ncbi:hypothetical protein B0I35DRAFT_224126 [Stachybotrys elegans]|uniref:BTB domain-containing protein n=1 Tax=Stachybotrys elegans TaxID=80388 RepID=A0A8K0SW63_9HYPO|nr:hypothetical protein B0I35DRAFT_224126 [Stachybotrys elegans]
MGKPSTARKKTNITASVLQYSSVPTAQPKPKSATRSKPLETLEATPTDTVRLKPASPPKINPWHRKQSTPPRIAAETNKPDAKLREIIAAEPATPSVASKKTYSSVVAGPNRNKTTWPTPPPSLQETPRSTTATPETPRDPSVAEEVVQTPRKTLTPNKQVQSDTAQPKSSQTERSSDTCLRRKPESVGSPAPKSQAKHEDGKSENTKPEKAKHEKEKGKCLVSGPTTVWNPNAVSWHRQEMQPSASLWSLPVGADVMVCAQGQAFVVHRYIVVPLSGWFRDNLPASIPVSTAQKRDAQSPPASVRPADSEWKHEFVKVELPYAAAAVACCLKFMYTKHIEFCVPDTRPMNIFHLPRCVLLYCAAVCLRIDSMAEKILHVVEKTAMRLWETIGINAKFNGTTELETEAFMGSLRSALELTHTERDQGLMMPMRLALASVLDASMLFIIRQPSKISIMSTDFWQNNSDKICEDLQFYRAMAGSLGPERKFYVLHEKVLKMIFDDCLSQKRWQHNRLIQA